MFGTQGNGELEFHKPTGIALDDKGKIYVTDFYNSRIQIFDSSGKFDSFIFIDGTGGDRPHGIDIEKNKKYLAIWSNDNPRVDIFDENNNKNSSFESGSVGQGPADVAIDKFGKIYVTDFKTGSIQIFDSSGILLNTIILPHAKDMTVNLTGIDLDDLGNIYVSDYRNGKIIKLDSFGNFLLEFFVPSEMGTFHKPTNLSIDPNGFIFVTDNSDRLLVFDSFGNFQFSFGQSGEAPGNFSDPHGIAFDNFGLAYVVEYSNNRVQIFNILQPFEISQDTYHQEKSAKHISEQLWFDEFYDLLELFFSWLNFSFIKNMYYAL